MKMLLLNLILLTLIACQSQSEKAFNPDISVNGIELSKPETTTSYFGQDVWSKVFERKDYSVPRIECINKRQNTMMRLGFNYGGSKNSVSQFEVSYMDINYSIPEKAILVSDSFITTNRIYLGLNKSTVIKVLGDKFKETKSENETTIRYEINEKTNKAFLTQYNMPLHFADYVFRSDKLTRFSFGFEYP